MPLLDCEPPTRVNPDYIAPLLVVGPDAPESQYRGVYPYHRGSGWVARVRVPDLATGRRPLRFVSRALPLPSQAAFVLAKWFETQYGPDWPRVVRMRARMTRHSAPWRAWLSSRYGGWLLCVWEKGRRTEVTQLTRDGQPTDELKVFPTRRKALEYVFRWARRRYGDDARKVLYRV